MGKNILIFSDGTGQAGGLTPDQNLSNVYKLFRASRTESDSPINPAEQIAFYDAGLGTTRDEGKLHVRIIQTVRKFASAALGFGLSRNIADCYEAILKHYEPGDRIYLFGFSRGAYTVRCVAGVLNLCGIPTRVGEKPGYPKYGKALRAIADEAVKKVYEHGAGKDRTKYRPEREEQATRFRQKYGSESNLQSNVAPYFIGVFDTVASLGARGFKKFLMITGIVAATVGASAIMAALLVHFGASFHIAFESLLIAVGVILIGSHLYHSFRFIRNFPQKGNFSWHLAGWNAGSYDESLDNRVYRVRHALAIDETRSDFARVKWGRKADHPVRGKDEPPWFEQIWFAGNHSDIGGSYAEDETRLSDISLSWMKFQATSLPFPVIFDDSKLHLFPSPDGMQHSEVDAVRDMFPLWWPAKWRFSWSEKLRSEAAEPNTTESTHHSSVLERFKLKEVLHYSEMRPYRPENLRKDPHYTEFYK